MLEVKIASNANELIEEISYWYVDTATIQENLGKQLEELNDMQLST